MGTMATVPSEPAPDRVDNDGVEKLLADLEGKYQKPDPENIALGTENFERILNSVIVPFIGINGLLIGSLVFYHLYPNRRGLISLCNLCAAMAVAGWIFYRRKQTNPFPVLFLSALPTFLLAASLALQAESVALVLALAI